MCRIDIIEYSYMLCIDIVGYIDIRSDLEMGIRMKNESPLLQIGQSACVGLQKTVYLPGRI